MSTIKVLNMSGAEVGTVELSDGIFGIEPNPVSYTHLTLPTILLV